MWWESDPCYRWESWVTTMNMNSKIFLRNKTFDKDSEKKSRTGILVKHLLEGRRFLEVIWNHHVSTSNFSTVCPAKRRELVRLRRDLPEHQSRGPKSCFFWGWSRRVEFFPLGIKKHRNIRWTWRNCFTSRVMVSKPQSDVSFISAWSELMKLIMSWYDNHPPQIFFPPQKVNLSQKGHS